MKNCNFQHHYLTMRKKNKIGTYYVLAAFHRAAIKMLKLGQESFSLWMWVMIQSCSSCITG